MNRKHTLITATLFICIQQFNCTLPVIGLFKNRNTYSVQPYFIAKTKNLFTIIKTKNKIIFVLSHVHTYQNTNVNDYY